ncbi:MAG: ABC transporter permease subunit [Phycisphaerae bacterium]|nr:ABC transporter permease subunit [Phycisphaerae bacterium]
MHRSRLLMVLLILALPAAAWAQVVRVGAKNFTEQEILGELIAQSIERYTDLQVERKFGLGGTDICHAALVGGELDVYVEYTGTALLNVLKRPVIKNPGRVFRVVAGTYRDRYAAEWLPAIGFNNTYALAVRKQAAAEKGLRTISDLRERSGRWRGGFTSEFMERPDGYRGLRRAYGIELDSTVDLDPGLMYQALAEGQVDLICAFATDGRIAEYGLQILEDDRRFFPPYDAAPVVRGQMLGRHPQIREALAGLAGTISDPEMRRMNHAVDVMGQDPAKVASRWLDGRGMPVAQKSTGVGTPDGTAGRASIWALALERRNEIGQKTAEHLVLTVLGVLIAIVLGVPLGILIHRRASARGPVLAVIEVLQTIPSLAMLAFLFALYGLLGPVPAVTALVLYALLPIVLNTFTGLQEVPAAVMEAARGVGMSAGQQLWLVQLPLAAPVAIAGIRAATVLTVGVATLSTYIGAGGLGDFIARGLARNDPRLTLLGAVPAAIMAVILSLLIRLAERFSRRS